MHPLPKGAALTNGTANRPYCFAGAEGLFESFVVLEADLLIEGHQSKGVDMDYDRCYKMLL